jgi:hypothetical protein
MLYDPQIPPPMGDESKRIQRIVYELPEKFGYPAQRLLTGCSF